MKLITINAGRGLKCPIAAVVALVMGGSVYAAPTVTGSTISWPDNGWYQVQNENGTENICNGETSCTVEPGKYIVINHTTGERTENVVVGSTTGSTTPTSPTVPTLGTGPTVVGNTITMPEDGWYQVQNASDYSSICNGTTTCVVEDGVYNVINHSTGVRYENVSVGVQPTVTTPIVDNDQPTGTTPIINVETWRDIFTKLVGPINTASFEMLDAEARESGEAQVSLSRVGDAIAEDGVTLTSVGENADGETELALSCDAGGSIVAAKLDGSAATPLDYNADNCQATFNLINGSYELTSPTRDGSGITEMNDFSITSIDGVGITASGTQEILTDDIGYFFSRTLNASSIVHKEGDAVTTITNYDGSLVRKFGTSESPIYIVTSDDLNVEAQQFESNVSLTAQFSIDLPAPISASFTVSVDMRYDGDYVLGGGALNNTGSPVFARPLENNDLIFLTMNAPTPLDRANWNRGRINIEASDGSSVEISPETFFLSDFYVQLADGTPRFEESWTDELTIFCEGPFEGCSR